MEDGFLSCVLFLPSCSLTCYFLSFLHSVLPLPRIHLFFDLLHLDLLHLETTDSFHICSTCVPITNDTHPPSLPRILFTCHHYHPSTVLSSPRILFTSLLPSFRPTNNWNYHCHPTTTTKDTIYSTSTSYATLQFIIVAFGKYNCNFCLPNVS